MTVLSIALRVFIVLLAIVSTLELAFVTSFVNWLIHVSSYGYDFRFNGSIVHIGGHPKNLLVDQGHTANGAAGTGLVLIAIGGTLALLLRTKAGHPASLGRNLIYYVWLVACVLALLLTTGALGYVFYLTNAHAGQTIDQAFAATLVDKAYPLDAWTPQNWFAAINMLDLVDGQHADVEAHLILMRGWQYNLIPFFLVQLVQTVLAVLEFMEWRRGSSGSVGGGVVHHKDGQMAQNYGV